MAVIRSPIREMARRWWLPLVAGVLWILFGMWLFSYRVGSLVALAVLIGITMIFSGFTEILVGPAVPIFRWLFLLAGALSLAGGAAILVWPGPTLFVIAVFLSWFLVITGTVHIIDAFARMGANYWWLRLVQGVIELVLGGWAHGDHVRSLLVLISLAGAFAIVRGVNAIYAAFELRQVDEVVRSLTV
jgi:uncharacterized membrane protein HdeD (DUF308 family)